MNFTPNELEEMKTRLILEYGTANRLVIKVLDTWSSPYLELLNYVRNQHPGADQITDQMLLDWIATEVLSGRPL